VPLGLSLPTRGTAVYETPAARELLQQSGLDDLDRLYALPYRHVARHRGRAVLPVALESAQGPVVSAFVKLNWGPRRLWPRMTDLKTGQFLQTLAEREWRGVRRLRDLGLLVPERVAYLKEGVWRMREAVVLRAVPPHESLHALIRGGRWQSLGRTAQDALLEAVAAAVRRIHTAGLAWRGVCTRHLFPKSAADGSWRLWLIDCEGVHGRAGAKAFRRDRRKLLRAFGYSGADRAACERLESLLAER
jgi:hypothetical protein